MLQFEDVGSVFNSIGSSQASTTPAHEDSKSNHNRSKRRKEQDYYDEEDEQPDSMVSENASVSTSIMDKLSSIFSIRGAA